MKKRVLLTLMALSVVATTGLCGCKKEVSVDDSSSTEIQEQAAEVKESADAVDLTQDEIDEFTDLFDSKEYNGFMCVSFANPTEIDWGMVLMDGAGIAKDEISKSERNAYIEATDSDEIYGDLTAIDASAIEEYTESHAGIKFADVKDDFTFTYVKKYDTYYCEHGDTNYHPYTCTEGKKLNNTYVLTFSDDLWDEESAYCWYPDHELTLEKTESGYLVKSNIGIYEKGNDPEQTFDIEYPGTGETARFITYQGTTDSAYMIITVNGVQKDTLTAYTYPDSYNEDGLYIKTVRAVGQFDFNADGEKDIVVVADCSDGKTHMMMYEAQPGYNDEYYYYALPNTSLWLEGFVDGGLNIPSIKKYLLGDSNGTYSNWKEAYTQAVKADGNEQSDMRFDIIYLDGDQTPELVLDCYGYWVSVYTFKDGHCVPLLFQESYGISGNGGYEYAPQSGKVAYSSTSYNAETDDFDREFYYMTINGDKVETESSGFAPAEDGTEYIPLEGKYEYTQIFDVIDSF